ncbi:MAG: L-threonine 3-dehydrogenase [Elusimicrobiales bacterium]|nr:L-threonine 3-dehydrogenase [Elusimicrobiales bacterium]
MKAIYKSRAAAGAIYGKVDIPVIKKDEILIRIDHTSICGSDMPIYNWTGWAPERIKTPMVFGHELAGEVVEIGQLARGFNKGDFVSVESHIFCGLCYQCRNDQRHVCSNCKIIGLDTPGGFSEYAAIPARCAWKHTDNSIKDIASIMEPFGNAVYATLIEDVVAKTVLVSGCGPQGLFSIPIAKASGAKTVIALDTAPYRRKLAEKMGADYVFNPADKNIESKIRKLLKNRDGVDVVVEMSGNPLAIDFGLHMLGFGGRFTAFGLPSSKIKINYSEDIVFKGLRVYGIVGREIFKSWYKMESLLKSKAVDPRPVITHKFSFKDYKKAFKVMNSKDKKCGKVILVP